MLVVVRAGGSLGREQFSGSTRGEKSLGNRDADFIVVKLESRAPRVFPRRWNGINKLGVCTCDCNADWRKNTRCKCAHTFLVLFFSSHKERKIFFLKKKKKKKISTRYFRLLLLGDVSLFFLYMCVCTYRVLFALLFPLVNARAAFPRYNIQFSRSLRDDVTCRVSDWKFHERAHTAALSDSPSSAAVGVHIVLYSRAIFPLRILARKRQEITAKGRASPDSCHSAGVCIIHEVGILFPTSGVRYTQQGRLLFRSAELYRTQNSVRLLK